MNGNVIRTITIRGTSEGLDKLTGDLKELAAAEKNVAIVSDDMSKRQLSLASSLKQQTLRLDEAARAQNNIARETRLADRGLRENLITQQQHAQIITLANQRYGTLATATAHARTGIAATAKTTALSSYEMLNFSRQIADVGVSLQAGQSPFTVIVQQGTQMADILATSGASIGAVFRQVGGTIARFAFSTGGAVTAVAAIGAAGTYSALKWNEAQVDVERSLLGIGQQSGATAGQINKIAQGAAATSKITTSSAREMTIALVQTGKIGVEQMSALVNRGHDFAKVLGEDIPEATKIMAQAFADPAKGVESLSTRFSITAKTIEQVQRLSAQGNLAGAQDVLTKALVPQLDQASKSSSEISKTWEGIKKLFSEANETMNVGLSRMLGTNAAAEKLAVAQGKLNALQITQVERAQTQERPTFFDKRLEQDIAAAAKEVAKFKTEVTEIDDKKFVELGKQAVKFADQIVTDTKVVNNLQDQLELFDTVLSTPKALEGLGEGQVKTLTRAAEVTRDQLEYVKGIRAAYPDVRVEVGKQLDLLNKQVDVAAARNQEERLAAQQAMDYTQALAAGASKAEALQLSTAQRRVAEAAIAKQENDLKQSAEDQLAIAKEFSLAGKARLTEEATFNQLRAQGASLEAATVVSTKQHEAALTEINRQASNIVGSLSDQANVASAIGGQAKVAAQAQATYNDMVRQGYNESQALLASEQTRRAGLGAINAAMSEQLSAMQDQGMIGGAATGAQKAGAQAQAVYNKAIREGATEAAAGALAQQSLANSQAAANAQVDNMIYEINKQADIQRVAGTSMEATTKAQYAYNDALRMGADAAHAAALEQAVLNAELAKNNKASAERRAQEAGGKYGQFESPYHQALRISAYGKYGYPGGATETVDALGMPVFKPTAEGIETVTNRLLGSGLGTGAFGGGTGSADSIEGIIQTLLTGEGSSKYSDVQQSALGVVSRLTDLLPDDRKAGSIQSQLQVLKGQPQTLATMELIKNLTSKLEELTKATEDNTSATSAMTDVLSPFYSSDPRRTHLGFRAFAGGGIMTQFGELPLKQYAGGGVATSPQVSVFGEGTSPEAYVPVPSGRIPVEIKQPANSNNKPVNVTIHVHGNADQNTVAALRTTGFQQAQAMRRAMR
jgi:hypothetical protein